jgi:electron transport complex protein RnfG
MNDTLRMFSVLTGVTAVCGVLLACVNEMTSDIISEQRIRFDAGPAIQIVFADATNDPVADRREIDLQGNKIIIYPGKTDDSVTGIALETKAPGYAGAVSVISGFDPVTGACLSIAIATSNETPGIGSKVKDRQFAERFAGLDLQQKAMLKKDGGFIDAMSGATISSRAVCTAVAKAQALFALYKEIHDDGAAP